MTIGLTGGIGCGKSSILSAFAKLGFAVFNSDEIAAEIHASPETCRFVRERFGENALDSAGAICKPALAKIVFENAEALAALENFMHPRIRAAWRSRVAAVPAGTDAVVEVPLLFEKNYERDFDATVCAAASPEIQLSRLAARGLPREPALARIACQLPLEEKIRRADAVVFNDGSPEFLEAQVREIAKNAARKISRNPRKNQ